MKKIKILSLFNGVSIFYENLRQMGLEEYVERYVSVENDKYANLVTKERVPNVEMYEDVRDFDGTKFQDFDILVFGSPCQSFSSIGSRTEFNGESGLFYQALQILKDCKPKHFIMENVNSASNRVKEIINKELGVKGVMLNSAELGSSQIRRRMFWSDLDITPPQTPIKGEVYQDIVENHNVVRTKYAPTLLTTHLCETKNGLRRFLGFGKMGEIGHAIFQHPIAKDLYKDELLDFYDENSTMGTKDNPTDFKNNIFRIPTVIECERLQGLPDNYTQVEGNSNSQRYKQLGNGFNTYHFKYIITQNLEKIFI